jgi:hypothetical protein
MLSRRGIVPAQLREVGHALCEMALALTERGFGKLTDRCAPGAAALARAGIHSGEKLIGNFVDGPAETDEGGAGWTAVPLDTDGARVRFDVVSARRAWVLAIGQGLWRTVDGSHWRLVGRL